MKKNNSSHLGQNFLINKGIAEKIIEEFFPVSESVLEIGPGKGVLTDLIINKAKLSKINLELFLVELDSALAEKLEKKAGVFSILNKSILEIKAEDFNNKNIQLIGNVPYYISKEILNWIIKNHKYIKSGVLMFQKEFVDKLLRINDPKTKNAQNLIFSYLYDSKKVASVSPGSFYPIPKVYSSVFKFNKSNKEEKLINSEDFYDFLKTCFLNRRKTLSNNLSHVYKNNILQILENINLKKSVRAEELNLDKFITIYKKINKKTTL